LVVGRPLWVRAATHIDRIAGRELHGVDTGIPGFTIPERKEVMRTRPAQAQWVPRGPNGGTSCHRGSDHS
jgi:hypothetical protein